MRNPFKTESRRIARIMMRRALIDRGREPDEFYLRYGAGLMLNHKTFGPQIRAIARRNVIRDAWAKARRWDENKSSEGLDF